MSEDQLLAEIVKRTLAAVPGVQKLILFGSCARGDARPDSDVDLIVITPEAAKDGPRTVAWRLALRHLDTSFDLIMMTPDEWADASTRPWTAPWEAAKEGRILHEAA